MLSKTICRAVMRLLIAVNRAIEVDCVEIYLRTRFDLSLILVCDHTTGDEGSDCDFAKFIDEINILLSYIEGW